MRVKFTKMQALGNDFVVIDAMSQSMTLTSAQAKWMADRRLGVGCDQILMVDSPVRDDVDFRFRIINADGGEVEQCGNGARAFALFVRKRGLTSKNEIRVETLNDVLTLHVQGDGQVRVNMGVPSFEPDRIPFVASGRQDVYDLAVADDHVEVSVVSMGNPHAVQVVGRVDQAPVATQGPLIEGHQRFPNRVNAGFMEVRDSGHIRLRVYERGVGETLACGSGACAAVVVGRKRGFLNDSVTVELPGGHVQVDWAGNAQPVYLIGSAEFVFEGAIDLNRSEPGEA